jgi:hypothetical protein
MTEKFLERLFLGFLQKKSLTMWTSGFNILSKNYAKRKAINLAPFNFCWNNLHLMVLSQTVANSVLIERLEIETKVENFQFGKQISHHHYV